MPRDRSRSTAHSSDYLHLSLPGPVYQYQKPAESPFPKWKSKKKEPAVDPWREPEQVKSDE